MTYWFSLSTRVPIPFLFNATVKRGDDPPPQTSRAPRGFRGITASNNKSE